jgi:hypothetical protein
MAASRLTKQSGMESLGKVLEELMHGIGKSKGHIGSMEKIEQEQVVSIILQSQRTNVMEKKRTGMEPTQNDTTTPTILDI